MGLSADFLTTGPPDSGSSDVDNHFEPRRRERDQFSPGVNINSRLSLCSRAAMTA